MRVGIRVNESTLRANIMGIAEELGHQSAEVPMIYDFCPSHLDVLITQASAESLVKHARKQLGKYFVLVSPTGSGLEMVGNIPSNVYEIDTAYRGWQRRLTTILKKIKQAKQGG